MTVRFSRTIGIAALAIACLFLAGEAFIPRFLESRLERAIVSGTDGVESVRVHLKAFPALALAFGRIDLLRMDVRGFVAGGLRVERLFVDAREASVDLGSLMKNGQLGVRGIGKGDATVILTEDDFNAYIASLDGLWRSLRIELVPGVARVSGRISVLGAVLDITFDGGLVTEGRTRLRYVVDSIRVGDATIPRPIQDELLRGLDLSVDASGLPVPIALREVRIEDGMLYVLGDMPGE